MAAVRTFYYVLGNLHYNSLHSCFLVHLPAAEYSKTSLVETLLQEMLGYRGHQNGNGLVVLPMFAIPSTWHTRGLGSLERPLSNEVGL